MENKKNILEELENEAPFLSKIKRENHFSTPKNYFKSLPEVMSGKNLNNKSLVNVFDKLSYRIFVPISAIAILFFIVINLTKQNNPTELTSEQLSEILIEDDYLEMDYFLVYEAYAELLDQEEETSSTDDEYINYLIENDIDINSIIEEL
jgi:hypothetical protein